MKELVFHVVFDELRIQNKSRWEMVGELELRSQGNYPISITVRLDKEKEDELISMLREKGKLKKGLELVLRRKEQ